MRTKTLTEPEGPARRARWRLTAAALGILILCASALTQLPDHPKARADEAASSAPKSFFLVARRDMGDPIFQQTVILMLPPEQPPLVAGVIINKPSDVSLNELFKHSMALANGNDKVYFGGPVELDSPLLVVQSTQTPAQTVQLTSDAYAIEDTHSIAADLKNPHNLKEMRLYLGRAQWTQQQLRGEVLEGAWDVMPVKTEMIFDHDPAKIWPELIQHEHVREVDIACHSLAGQIGFARCDP